MKITSVLIGMCMCSQICNSQDLYSYKNSLAFADHLYLTNQFSLAISEYERLVFLNPSIDTLKLRLLQSYSESGKYSDGVQRAEQMYFPSNSMPVNIGTCYITLLIKTEEFAKADTFLRNYFKLPHPQKLVLQGSVSALSGKWEQATSYVSKIKDEEYHQIPAYRSMFNEGMNLPRKSPVTAAGLSSILPGAGKIYTRNWKDGIISFLMTAGPAWQTYRSFSRKGSSSARGWIFASVTTGFYIGNIYGSYQSAKRHNQTLEHKTKQKIEELIYTDF